MRIILIILLTPFLLYSQAETGKKLLTLKDCIEIALDNNFDVQITEERVESADANLRSAFGRYLPRIAANVGYSRQLTNLQQSIVVGERLLDVSRNPNRYSATAGANLTIFDGFSREYNYSSADYNLDATVLNAKHTKRLVRLQVYQNYTDVVRNTQIVRIRRENLEQGKKDLERIKAQYDAGIIPINDVYAQESELGNLEFDLITAENNLFNTKAVLLQTMGLNPDVDYDFDVSSIPSDVTDREINSFYDNYKDTEVLVDDALDQRLDYKSNNMSSLAANSALNVAKGSYYPNISASSGWNWVNNEISQFSQLGNLSVGFQISVPIFQQFQVDAQVQNAELQLRQAEINKARIEQQVRTDIQLAKLKLDAARKQLDVTNRSLTAAEKNYEASNERFKIGAATIVEFQRSNVQFITAQINRINAVYNFLLAKREMLFAVGINE